MFAKVTEAVKGIFSVNTKKWLGDKISEDEISRAKEYCVRDFYYSPPHGGLYRSKLPWDSYLYEQRTWTTEPGITIRTLPEFLWAPFNPVKTVVKADTAAIMNEFDPKNIMSTKDGKTDIPTESEYLRNVFDENVFRTYMKRTFNTTGGQADSYPRIVDTRLDNYRGERMKYGIKLMLYPPQQVFPILWTFDCMRAIAYRIYYKQEVFEEINRELKLYQGTQKEFYSVIDSKGSKGWIGEKVVEEVNVPYGNDLPMIHFAHDQRNDFFGRSTCEDIFDDIDHINVNMSAMWLLIKRFINPIVGLKGVSAPDELPVPTKLGPIFFKLGLDGGWDPLLIELAASHLQAVRDFIDLVREKLPHFKLDRTEMSKQARRPETTEAMSESYISYVNDLMDNYQQPFSDLCNGILRIGMGVKEKRIIVAPMGPPMSEGVMDTISKVKEVVGMFGKHAVLLRKVADKLELEDDEIDEMIGKMEEEDMRSKEPTPEEEANNMTKTLLGAITKKKPKLAKQQVEKEKEKEERAKK